MLDLLDLGATVHRLEVTGGDGVRRNVVLGHPTAQDYLDSSDYLGGTVGRYANRIAGGRFHLDGHEVRLGAHDRGNTLHGGPDGFDRRYVGGRGGTAAPRGRCSRCAAPTATRASPARSTCGVTVEVTEDAVADRPSWRPRTHRPS